MRKTIATLAAIVAGVGAFGSTAGPAAADDPNAYYSNGGTAGFSRSLGCATPTKAGVLGQYGAWGYYIDGCTVKLTCPPHTGLFAVKSCDVESYTKIETQTYRGDRVTMNAKLRRFDSSGQVLGWSDKSCDGRDKCETGDFSQIAPGQSASVQCNGVREAKADNSARVYCSVWLRYR